MIRFGLFLMNRRGYDVITNFVASHGPASVSYVVGSEDRNVKQDYYVEIKKFCLVNNIIWANREDYCANDYFEDYKIAIGWRWLIGGAERLIVMHDSLLPKYRGFAPTVNMLINGEPRLGVTALLATNEYDRGDVLLQKSVSIEYPLKINDAISLISPIYAEMLSEIYDDLSRGVLKSIPQDRSNASYSPWLDEDDYFIDWQWPASKIVRFVNAVGFPFDGAKGRLNGEIIQFVEVEEMSDVFVEDRLRHIGKVIFMNEGVPVIVCGSGLIAATDIMDKESRRLKVNFRSRFV